jgi:hypothetical protein
MNLHACHMRVIVLLYYNKKIEHVAWQNLTLECENHTQRAKIVPKY